MSEWAKSHQIQRGEDLARSECPSAVDVVPIVRHLDIPLLFAEIALQIVQHFLCVQFLH